MAAETKRRHLGYFRELAEAETGQLRGAEQTAAMERLALEQGNLRAALTTALENRDQESALSIVAACAYFWESRGQFFEAHEWFRRVLQHDDGVGAGQARGGPLLGEAARGAANELDRGDRAPR